MQLREEGISHYQVDYWGWSLRELTSLRVSQDDMNLILGGNAARIFDLDFPFTRLFKPPSYQVGRGSKNHPDSTALHPCKKPAAAQAR